MTLLPLVLLSLHAHAGTTSHTTPPPATKPTTITTSDGVTLQAALGTPAKAGLNGVVFVPMIGRGKEDWVDVMADCQKAGAFVLSFDLRGMGANVAAGAAPTTPTADDYQKMMGDVKAAIALLKTKGVTRVTVVGAELGANLGANVAAEDAAVVDLVLLSPGMDYKGVIATDAVKRYGDRPVYMAASGDDPYSAQSVARLTTIATGPQKVDMFETAGKGTKMLNHEPELEGNIAGWVAAHWTPAVVAPTPPPTTITVKPDTSAVETTGPTSLPPK